MVESADLAATEAALRELQPASGVSLGGRWLPAAALLADPDTAAELVRDHARVRAIAVERHAASLFFQRYCHRLASATIGVWVLTGQALDAAAPEVAVQVRDGSPVGVQLTGRRRAADTPEELVGGLVEEHLLSLAGLVHDGFGMSLPNLWGNIAASIGMAARTLSRIRPAAQVREAVEPVLAVRPELTRLGSFRILTGPHGDRLFYDRATCCHWHEIPNGAYCSYCSRLSPQERTRRFTESMLAEPQPPVRAGTPAAPAGSTSESRRPASCSR